MSWSTAVSASRPRSTWGHAPFVLALATAACGAGDGAGLVMPALEVRTTTTGTELDPDGYSVVVDMAPGESIGITDTLIIDPLAPGQHTITLAGLAGNCTTTGGPTTSATIAEGTTAIVAFAVICGPTQGQVVVTTATSGDSPDSDGYQVELDDTGMGAVGVNDSRTLPGVPPGPHQITLSGVAPNCSVGGDNPRPVVVTAGADSTVSFVITCVSPTGSIHVRVTTLGTPTGPEGYTVSLDGASPATRVANGMADLDQVPFGPHRVTLGGVAANCTVQSPNPLDIQVPLGGEVTAEFTVNCVGDSQVIAFSGNAIGLLAVFVVSPDGTGLTDLTPDGVFERDPIWSPDGRRILFVRVAPSFASEALYVMNGDGSDRTQLSDDAQVVDYRWSPDGSRIAFSRGRIQRGQLFSDLWVMQADGSGKRRLATDGESPSWSPDGTQIAYVHDVDNVHIRIVGADGSGDRRLTADSLTAIQPAWSPDGSRIAFTSVNPNQIRVINADGSNLLDLTPGTAQEDGPVWAPDGSRIAFNTGPEDEPLESEVAVMNPDGSGRMNLTDHPGFDFGPDWSPDGRRMVFVRTDDSDNEIYVMNSDGSNPIDVSNRPNSFESSPDWGGQPSVPVAGAAAKLKGRWLRLPELRARLLARSAHSPH